MRWVLILAAFFGASSVIIGAALQHLGGDMDVLQTALRYHQLHSIVLLALGLYALNKAPSWRLIISPALFALGTLVFSSSLYLMVIFHIPELGNLTPIGGMFMIAGWFFLPLLIRNENELAKMQTS